MKTRVAALALAGLFIASGIAWAADNYRLSVPGGLVVSKRAVELSTGLYSDVVLAGSQYPAAATPITISATGTTAAVAATLAASATKTTYICGFAARGNATAAVTGNLTVAGTVTGTLNFTHFTAPVATGIGVTEQRFSPCIPASAVNTTIVITAPAAGTAGIASVSAWGYQL